MTDIEKKKYNKVHYQNNKEALRNRAISRYKLKKESARKVVSLFENSEPSPLYPKPKTPKMRSRQRRVSFSLLVLVSMMTYFLISETAKFYFEFDGNIVSAHLKAFILEGSVFSFALARPATSIMRFFNRLMIIILYAYDDLQSLLHSGVGKEDELEGSSGLKMSEI